MVKVIVRILVKDMVMSSSSSTIIRSNGLSLSPVVPGDSFGDFWDGLGTGFRDTGDKLEASLGDRGNGAGDDNRSRSRAAVVGRSRAAVVGRFWTMAGGESMKKSL